MATITFLFVDQVGSTEQLARLGDVDTVAVRDRLQEILRDAIATTGGVVVDHTGDGVMASFVGATEAVAAGVAMLQAAERVSRAKPDRALSLRVGVHTGEPQANQEGRHVGMAVVIAARLCSVAEPGQLLVSELVRLLVGDTYSTDDAGERELKGVPAPVRTFAVQWEPAKALDQLPLPSRLAAKPVTGVVGRVLERELLLATLKGAFAGEGHRVVLLSGEPGIGKTTLAADLAQRAHDDGATVLYGRCDEDRGVPYQPFVEALGGFFTTALEPALLALDARRLSELSRLLPEVRDRLPTLAEPPSTDPDAERYLLFGAITSVLAAMAATAPVVLVLDDLHWADKPTVLLLRHLVTTLDRAAVLVVGTYRDTDLTAAHPLREGLAALRSERTVDRVVVGGLDDNGVVALLEGLAGHQIDSDGVELARAVRRETDGNPFFTAEVLRHLSETGAIRQQAGRWVAAVELSAIGLPESVREVIGQRVRRLGDNVAHVLSIASVIGRDFDLAQLARVAERDEGDVLDALEAAAATQIVAEVHGRSEQFTFSHALFQHILYDGLSASRRARVHRRIGEILEVDCGDDPGDRIGELAHHWGATARPGDAGKAAGYARLAAERALAALAPDEAIRWFRRAIELMEAVSTHDPLPRLDVVIALGDAQRQAGDPGYRETLLDAAADAGRLGDTVRLVDAALANQRGMVSSIGAVDAERIAMLERALVAVGDVDSRARAWLLAALAAELTSSGQFRRVQGLAADAESIARRLGDDGVLLRVLNLIFVPLWVPDGLARSVAASEEALILADRVGDPVARYWAALHRFYAMSSSADRGGIDPALALAVSLAHEIGQPYLKWQVTLVQGPIVLLTGDADEAERLAIETLQIGSDSGQPDAVAGFGGNLAAVRWHQGRVDEILPLIAQAAADNPGLPGFQAAYAVLLCECGRFDEARPLLDEASGADFHNSAYDWIWLTTTALWADTAASLGEASAGAILYERLAPFETQGATSGNGFVGTVGMYLARLATLLGRHDDALRLFERTDVRLHALRAPFFQARNQVEWARFLSAGGADADLRRARSLLAEATKTAVTYGCGGVERRANELTRALA